MAIVDGEPLPNVVEGRRLAMEEMFRESSVSGGEEEDTAMQSDDGSNIVGEPTVDEGGACDNSDEGDHFHVHVECVDWIGTVTYFFRRNGSPYIDQVYKVVPNDKSSWHHLRFDNREAFVKFYRDDGSI
ncbi:unnamed protein product [Linum trigynum]|uniref:Uncharacterized protein n=1 Tax=Linum trigynum TaxID=586398 RepID=A0AAV2E2E4_9ROSI